MNDPKQPKHIDHTPPPPPRPNPNPKYLPVAVNPNKYRFVYRDQDPWGRGK